MHFFFQAEDGIRDTSVTGVQTCALPICTPTVAIFGSTVPAFGFGPRGPHDRVVQLDGLPCRPCSAHGPPSCPLGHHLCMKSLSVEDVLLAIEETGALHRRN